MTVYTALVQCTDIAADRQSVHCIKAVYTVTNAPEDRRVCRPKHVEQIQISIKKINKRKLLHLVGCLLTSLF